MAETSLTLSETAVATMAAGILDEYSVNSLDDNHPIARYMAREFSFVRDEVLRVYPWSFARTRALLPRAATAPAFGWDYAYEIPADCLRLLPLTYQGELGGDHIPFAKEGSQILTNSTGISNALPVYYISKTPNLTKWDILAARAFACRLAMYAATRITGKSSYFDKANMMFRDALNLAMHVDSLERGTQEIWGSDTWGDSVLDVRGSII